MAKDDDEYVIIEGDDDFEPEVPEDLRFGSSPAESPTENTLNDPTIPNQRSLTGTISFSFGLTFGFIEFVTFFIIGALKRGAPINIHAILKGELLPLALLMIPLGLHAIAIAVAFCGFMKKDGRRGMIIAAIGLNLAGMGGVAAIAGLSLLMK